MYNYCKCHQKYTLLSEAGCNAGFDHVYHTCARGDNDINGYGFTPTVKICRSCYLKGEDEIRAENLGKDIEKKALEEFREWCGIWGDG